MKVEQQIIDYQKNTESQTRSCVCTRPVWLCKMPLSVNACRCWLSDRLCPDLSCAKPMLSRRAASRFSAVVLSTGITSLRRRTASFQRYQCICKHIARLSSGSLLNAKCDFCCPVFFLTLCAAPFQRRKEPWYATFIIAYSRPFCTFFFLK